VHLLLALMLIKHVPPARVGYWKENGDELDYLIVGKLDDRDRDRVCGFVVKTETGYDVQTLKSGGAKTGFDGKANTLELAKYEVERDCR
jgi:hypothetical protein